MAFIIKAELTSPEAAGKACTFFQAIRFFCFFHLSLSATRCQAFHPHAYYSHISVSLPAMSSTSLGMRHMTSVGLTTEMMDSPFGNSEVRNSTTSTTTNSWEMQFRNLERFHQEYGHANVPQHTSELIQRKYPRLAHFCKNQRSLYKNHKTARAPLSALLQERKNRLESLGFDFDVRHCLWDSKYEKLYAFWKEHGHLKVEKSKHPDLYSWMHYQRQKYKSSDNKTNYKPLTNDQVERLERINFCWSPKEAEWWNNYNMLQKHKEQHGNWDSIADAKLRSWKNSLRRSCREYVLAVTLEGSTDGVHVSGLSGKRLKALREIRFCWLPEQIGPLKGDPPKDIFDGYQ